MGKNVAKLLHNDCKSLRAKKGNVHFEKASYRLWLDYFNRRWKYCIVLWSATVDRCTRCEEHRLESEQ